MAPPGEHRLFLTGGMGDGMDSPGFGKIPGGESPIDGSTRHVLSGLFRAHPTGRGGEGGVLHAETSALCALLESLHTPGQSLSVHYCSLPL